MNGKRLKKSPYSSEGNAILNDTINEELYNYLITVENLK